MQNRAFLKFEDQMRSLEKKGIITLLSCHPQLPGFIFNLGRIRKIEGLRLYENFSQYRYRIIFINEKPYVFPDPLLESKGHKNHINSNLSLCLYHENEFKWQDKPYLDQYIIPWIYMWQYYYNEWKKSKIWVGPEYHRSK